MIRYALGNMNIEVFDDPTFTAGSDNLNTYLINYFSDKGGYHGGSLHGIKVYDGDTEVTSCLLIGSGGTTIHEHSTLLDDNLLLIRCGDTLFCLNLPDLQLRWQKQVDPAVCFQIFKIEEDYLTHGEMEVTRIDKHGQIKWTFSGADIFVVLDNTEAIIICDDHIVLTDFQKNTYKIDFNGKMI